MDRRTFLTTAGAAVGAAAALRAEQVGPASPSATQTTQQFAPGKARFKTGLVAYSFMKLLGAKTMKYEDLIRIACETGIDGIDMTAYWFDSTDDSYLLPLRRLAYRNRVEIYSIGTRVQLAQPAGEARDKMFAELKKWVDVAQKLGASHMRVFGSQKPQTATVEQAIEMAGDTMKMFADYSGTRGVTLGVEDDGGMTEHAAETLAIVKRANHPWAGMNLDIGNFRAPKVLEQIEMSIPYAVSTHIKTTMALDDGTGRAPFDMDKIYAMFAKHGYRGYMGLEFEATGDPVAEVPKVLRQLRDLAFKYST